MIYVVTYTGSNGFIGFLGGRHTSKRDADRTIKQLQRSAERMGRSNITLREFKNMKEAFDWRDVHSVKLAPPPVAIDASKVREAFAKTAA